MVYQVPLGRQLRVVVGEIRRPGLQRHRAEGFKVQRLGFFLGVVGSFDRVVQAHFLHFAQLRELFRHFFLRAVAVEADYVPQMQARIPGLRFGACVHREYAFDFIAARELQHFVYREDSRARRGFAVAGFRRRAFQDFAHIGVEFDQQFARRRRLCSRALRVRVRMRVGRAGRQHQQQARHHSV